MRNLLFLEVLLAVVAVSERVQGEAFALRSERQQMRLKRRILDQIVHSWLAHFDIGASIIRLYVASGTLLEGRTILQEAHANWLLCVLHAQDGIHRPGMVSQHRFGVALVGRGNPVVIGAPAAIEDYAPIVRLLPGFEVDHIAIVVLLLVLERAAAEPVADVGLLRGATARRSEGVLVRFRGNLRDFGVLR